MLSLYEFIQLYNAADEEVKNQIAELLKDDQPQIESQDQPINNYDEK